MPGEMTNPVIDPLVTNFESEDRPKMPEVMWDKIAHVTSVHLKPLELRWVYFYLCYSSRLKKNVRVFVKKPKGRRRFLPWVVRGSCLVFR
jgi:hypothetical protein